MSLPMTRSTSDEGPSSSDLVMDYDASSKEPFSNNTEDNPIIREDRLNTGSHSDTTETLDEAEESDDDYDDELGDETGLETEKGDKRPSTQKGQEDPTNLILQAVSHKEEGNNFFKSGNLIEASRSYRKGTSLLKNLNNQNTGDDQVKSLLLSLQTNLSMVCLKQNKPKQSRDIASKALSVDGTNVKALYRRAIANRKLGDVDNARRDLKLALQYDPENSDVKRELLSLKKEIDEMRHAEKCALQKAFSQKSGSSLLYSDKEEDERRKIAEKLSKEEAEKEALKKRKSEWEMECANRVSSGRAAISFEEWEKERKSREEEEEKAKKKAKKENEERKRAEKKVAKHAASSITDDDDDDEQLTEKELQMFRGYKKTKDGRTTSYFTMERSDDEALKLGTVLPQRLDSLSSEQCNVSPLPRTDSICSDLSMKRQGSVWNEAGTWEEKDTSEWCSSNLRKYLEATTHDCVRYLSKAKEVEELTGEASVAVARGKKRYLFDYRCKVKYDIIDSADESVVATGSLHLPDISSTAMCEKLEIDARWKMSPHRDILEEVTSCRQGFMEEMRLQVAEFVAAFNREF